jgi:hypothetical protein
MYLGKKNYQSIVTVGILQNYIQKTLSKNKLRMLLTFNYVLIDVKQIPDSMLCWSETCDPSWPWDIT